MADVPPPPLPVGDLPLPPSVGGVSPTLQTSAPTQGQQEEKSTGIAELRKIDKWNILADEQVLNF